VAEAVLVVVAEVSKLAGVERDGDAVTLEQVVRTALERTMTAGTNLNHRLY
jgi:hypothetical protein